MIKLVALVWLAVLMGVMAGALAERKMIKGLKRRLDRRWEKLESSYDIDWRGRYR